MALRLEDLIAGQKKLEESTKKVESMSLDQLKELTNPGGTASAQVTVKDESFKALSSNINKLIDAIKKNTAAVNTLINKKPAVTPVKPVKPTSSQAMDLSETQIEQENRDKKLYDILVKIEKNTRGEDLGPAKDKKADEGDDFFGIGGLLTGLALTIGTVVGLLSGYVKTLKFFGIDLAKGAELLKNKFTNFFGKFGSVLDDAVNGIKGKLGASLQDSKIMKLFSTIKTAITNYFKPISALADEVVDGSKFIGNIVGGIKSKFSAVTGFIDDIGRYFKGFQKVFGAFSKIVSKIATPIMAIMTIWDTIQGALKGFEEEGIIGGIKGAIKGFVNSLIMAPLDMLKGLVSWVAGAFGFDEVEKTLDSFSFADEFNKIVEMIFHPIDTLKNIMKGVTDYLTNIQIPKFDIDVFGYKKSFGPFKPFSFLGSSTQSAEPVPPKGTPQYAEGKIKKAEPKAVTADSAELVTLKSKEATAPTVTPSASNTVVSAPTTINKQTKNIMVKQPIRNSDSSLNSYIKSRYAT